MRNVIYHSIQFEREFQIKRRKIETEEQQNLRLITKSEIFAILFFFKFCFKKFRISLYNSFFYIFPDFPKQFLFQLNEARKKNPKAAKKKSFSTKLFN